MIHPSLSLIYDIGSGNSNTFIDSSDVDVTPTSALITCTIEFSFFESDGNALGGQFLYNPNFGLFRIATSDRTLDGQVVPITVKANFVGYFNSDELDFTVTFRGSCADAELIIDPNIFDSVNLPSPFKIGDSQRTIWVDPSMVTV